MRNVLYPGNLLMRAIQNHKTVHFEYHGESRRVEPHIYGRARNGNVLLQGYQVGNGSRSGKLPDWRTFHVADIRDLEITGETFRAEPGYNPDDPDFTEVFARVEWPALRR